MPSPCYDARIIKKDILYAAEGHAHSLQQAQAGACLLHNKYHKRGSQIDDSHDSHDNNYDLPVYILQIKPVENIGVYIAYGVGSKRRVQVLLIYMRLATVVCSIFLPIALPGIRLSHRAASYLPAAAGAYRLCHNTYLVPPCRYDTVPALPAPCVCAAACAPGSRKYSSIESPVFTLQPVGSALR